MKLKKPVLLLVAAVSLTGCAIKHPIADDYGRYLRNGQGTSNLPKTDLSAYYALTENTKQHKQDFRIINAGYGNVWIAEFGKFLRETLESRDVQNSFRQLSENEGEISAEDYRILFNLQNYLFDNFTAHISLEATLSRGDDEIFRKIYTAHGRPQDGKVYWGGVLAIKNAVQQSTKYAMDEIMTDLISDINKANL